MSVIEYYFYLLLPLYCRLSPKKRKAINSNTVKNSRTIPNDPNFLYVNKVPRKIEFLQSKVENTLKRTETNKTNESGFVYTFTSWHCEDIEDLRLTGVKTSHYSATNKTLMREAALRVYCWGERDGYNTICATRRLFWRSNHRIVTASGQRHEIFTLALAKTFTTIVFWLYLLRLSFILTVILRLIYTTL